MLQSVAWEPQYLGQKDKQAALCLDWIAQEPEGYRGGCSKKIHATSRKPATFQLFTLCLPPNKNAVSGQHATKNHLMLVTNAK